jgi:hypothetical protein
VWHCNSNTELMRIHTHARTVLRTVLWSVLFLHNREGEGAMKKDVNVHAKDGHRTAYAQLKSSEDTKVHKLLCIAQPHTFTYITSIVYE